MTRYLIDTNIVRFYIEGNPKVIEFWKNSRENNDTFLLSMVTVGELRSQFIELNKDDRTALRRLLRAFPKVVSPSPADKKAHAYRRMARAIRKQHQKENKPFQPRLHGLADAKIAVDAINEQIDIVTQNTKDFHIARFFGVRIYNPITESWFKPIPKTKGSPALFILPDEKYE